ncbi:MAG: 4'-phosphopantetheinyl transferase superfamily protein [Oscillospiraceae bacterium]|nr:4'-phosphopantetheinyl transferase superfamily protein [Oscillospiraceae bacterium]
MLRTRFRCTRLPPMARDANGKPFFPTRPEIFFNLSHSGGFALCGVGDSPIGVDIELVRPRRPGLARRVLAEEEQAQLARAEDPVRRLIAFWTLKESYGKCTGDGILGLPLRERVFSVGDSGAVSFCQPGYQFVLVEQEAFCAALCTDEREETPKKLIQIPLDVEDQR